MAADPQGLEEMLTRLQLTAIRDQLDNSAGRGGPARDDAARGGRLPVRARDRPQGRDGGSRWRARSRTSPPCAIWTASTSPPSPRSTRGRSAIWRPAAGWRMARHCCCWARPASARRIWRSPSAARPSARAIRCCSSPRPPWSLHWPRPMPRAGWRSGSAFYAKPKLLIIDELGYLPFDPNAAHLFFQLVSRRYERGSLLITSNRSVGEWGSVFGDAVVATAILDRLLHHSHVVTIRGDSYRLREKRRAGLIKAAPLDQVQLA